MSSRDRFGLVGNTIAGTFRVDEVVAEGGFGIIYRAYHLHFRSPVALKCLKIPVELTEGERINFLEQFRSEAEIMFRLSASLPNIVRPLHVDAVSTDDGHFVPLMALEWLEGETFETIIEKRTFSDQPPMPLTEVIELLTPAAYALHEAHNFDGPDGRMRIIHRDVKPDNLFLTTVSGIPVVKILDFGISKVRRQASQLAGHASQTSGQAPFSPAYGAPEQWLPKRYGQTGPWTDVWGLALTIEEIIKGDAVIIGDHQAMMGTALDEKKRPTPRNEGVRITDEIEGVFLKALAVDPRYRYQSVKDFWDALQRALSLGGDPTLQVEETPSGRFTLPPMSAPTPWTPPPIPGQARAKDQPEGLPPMLAPALLEKSPMESMEAEASEDGPSFPNNPASGLAPVPPAPIPSGSGTFDLDIPSLTEDSVGPEAPDAEATFSQEPGMALAPVLTPETFDQDDNVAPRRLEASNEPKHKRSRSASRPTDRHRQQLQKQDALELAPTSAFPAPPQAEHESAPPASIDLGLDLLESRSPPLPDIDYPPADTSAGDSSLNSKPEAPLIDGRYSNVEPQPRVNAASVPTPNGPATSNGSATANGPATPDDQTTPQNPGASSAPIPDLLSDSELPPTASPDELAAQSTALHKLANLPAAAKPAAAKPAAARPAAARPAAKSAVARPVAARPVAARPVAAKPAAAKPAAVRPAAARPAAARPAAAAPTARPAAAKPAADKPALSRPQRPTAEKKQAATLQKAKKQVPRPASAKPATARKPTAKPTAGRPTAEPAASRPTAKPAASRPAAKSHAVPTANQPAAPRPSKRPPAPRRSGPDASVPTPISTSKPPLPKRSQPAGAQQAPHTSAQQAPRPSGPPPPPRRNHRPTDKPASSAKPAQRASAAGKTHSHPPPPRRRTGNVR